MKNLEKIINLTAWTLLVGSALYLTGRELEKYGAESREDTQYKLNYGENPLFI